MSPIDHPCSGPSTSVTACRSCHPTLLTASSSCLVTRGNANFHTYVSQNYYDPDKVSTSSDFNDVGWSMVL